MTLQYLADRLQQIGLQARHLNAAYHADRADENEKKTIEARLIELRREENKLRLILEEDHGERLQV